MTVLGMFIPILVALVVWSFWKRGAVPYEAAPLRLVTPGEWWIPGYIAAPQPAKDVPGYEALLDPPAVLATNVYNGVFFAVLVWAVARLGSWPAVIRHLLDGRSRSARAGLSALVALAALSLVFPDAFPGAGWNPLPVVGPLFDLVVLVSHGYDLFLHPLFPYGVYAVVTLLVLWPFARIGDWFGFARDLSARLRADQETGQRAHELPPSQWPELRQTGQHQAADVLTDEVADGHMNDVDVARVAHAFEVARRNASLATFRDTVLRQAGAAWTHPSGARELARRTAQSDLLADQVRIGSWVAGERVPPPFHGAGAALSTDVLGTSLLVVGPPGSGKTQSLVNPLSEFLCLKALTRQASVVVVGAAGAGIGADTAYDVVVRIGDPDSVHDLDLYGGVTDPDEAAAVLAEALVGDLDGSYPGSGHSRALTVLAQLLGPFHAVHRRFPSVPELRQLLNGVPGALGALREGLGKTGQASLVRELDALEQQLSSPDSMTRVLADRVALLDRPTFAGFFDTSGRSRPFSLNVLDHPVRVRVDLPTRGHADASRILARLVLAQFTAHVTVREDRSLFACLVLDDATATITPRSVRRIQELRSRNAGVVLTLSSVADIPEALHGPLFGAFGCRMAFSGISAWDGSRFAQAWGTEWTEVTEVAKHTVFADQPMTRALHTLRKLATGKAVTTDAVTKRQVERERWSASELAHAVPPGHAVLSLTTVKGEHAPPILVDLRG